MPEEFELQDLSKKKQFTSSDGVSTSEVSYGAVWAWTSATILSLLSLTLIMSPRFILFTAGETRLEPTSLEAFLSFNLGVLLATITLSLILNIPSSGPLLPWKSAQQLQRHPELIPLTAGGLVMSFLCYNTANLGYLSTLFSCVTGTIGLCGLWTIMFDGHPKQTVADGRTSAFIFGNRAAASVLRRRHDH